MDFKKAQYKFRSATDFEKSELLKDILAMAMANAWSAEDRYIVIGIEEGKTKPNIYHGIKEHIDDSRVQQFVNAKTSRVYLFEWRSCTYKGKDYAVIRISVQERPVFLLKDFGKLKANNVYVRRGTSTAIANPDEIKEMAIPQTVSAPSLQVCYCKEGSELMYLDELDVEGKRLVVTDDVPDHKEYTGLYGVNYMLDSVNKDFYRDYIGYANFLASYYPIRLAVRNVVDIEARNVKVEILISKAIDVVHEDMAPSLPSKRKPLIESAFSPIRTGYTIKEFPDQHLLSNEFDCIHAKLNITLEGKFFCSVEDECDTPWEVVVYYDGASEPIVAELSVRMKVSNEYMEWHAVKAISI